MRVWLDDRRRAADAGTAGAAPGLVVARVARERARRVAGRAPGIWLIDPLGNLVLALSRAIRTSRGSRRTSRGCCGHRGSGRRPRGSDGKIRSLPASPSHAASDEPSPMTTLALAEIRFRQFLALTKPRVVSLIVFVAMIGMFLAVPGLPPPCPSSSARSASRSSPAPPRRSIASSSRRSTR